MGIPVVEEGPVKIVGEYEDGELYVIIMDGEHGHTVWRPRRDKEKVPTDKVIKVKESFVVRGASEGFMYVESEDRKKGFVGNPVTGEWISISPCRQEINGYDSYKLDFEFLVDTSCNNAYYVVVYDREMLAVFSSTTGKWNFQPVIQGPLVEDWDGRLEEDAEGWLMAPNMSSKLFVFNFAYDPAKNTRMRCPDEGHLPVTLGLPGGMAVAGNGNFCCTLFKETKEGLMFRIYEWIDRPGRWEEVASKLFRCPRLDFDLNEPVWRTFSEGSYVVNCALSYGSGDNVLCVYDSLEKTWSSLKLINDLPDGLGVQPFVPNKRKLFTQEEPAPAPARKNKRICSP